MKPDTALIRLTVGCGSAFESSGGGVVLIDEQAFEPVVAALADAGVSKDDIYLNTFSGSSYGPSEGAAVITFKWRQPQEVTKILTTAQRAVRKETDDNRGLGGELGCYPTGFAPQRCGMSGTLASGLFEYYAAAAAATADEVTLATTLEVTFALEQ